MSQYKFETLQQHAGQHVDQDVGARQQPIYLTSGYVFQDIDHASDLFNLDAVGHIYSRITNPTVATFEERVAQLEGGTAAVATASGMAAITYAILAVANAGDHIISTTTLYGGTSTLFVHTLKKFGIDVSFVDTSNLEEVEKAIQENTKALFVEIVGNPKGNIEDIEGLAQITQAAGIPLIVDNTFASPYLCRPIEHGANIVVHSGTKYLDGHGSTVSGVIIDGGNFDYNTARFPGFSQPDESYHGIVFSDKFGEQAFAYKVRTTVLRDTGAALSPFNAFILLLGLETLSLRVERHVANAEKVAEYLSQHPQVEWLSYAGLADSPYYALKEKYLPKGAGAVINFGIKGGYEAGVQFINHLKLFSLVANLGDTKSLVIHPASTTHSQLSEEEQRAAGVEPEAIRLSIGIEHIDDILADLEQAFEHVTQA